MREILFRGKTKKGKWVEGDLIHGVRSKYGKLFILPIAGNLAYIEDCDPLDGVEVIPETVGQITGLLDKNGIKIFEGDKVKCGYGIGVVIYNAGCFMVQWLDDNESYSELLFSRKGTYARKGDEEFEVIGNIHDEVHEAHTHLLSNLE